MKLIIKGVTESGGKFRPSDWAQRLATAAGTTSGGRIRYHPKVAVVMREGINCVIVDSSLEEEDPTLYTFLTGFAKNNQLQTEEQA